MTVRGTPAFTGLAILEIETIDYRVGGTPSLVAHAAFINERTGHTYGSTTGRTGWSPQTLIKLAELRLSMEADLAALVFEEEGEFNQVGATTGRVSSAHENFSNPPRSVGGIGEDLRDDVPSV